MKVLFTTNIPSPYRIDFFNELGKYCDLTVTIERESASDRSDEWKKYDIQNFKLIKLKGKNIGKDKAFCLDVIKVIKYNKFDIIIVGGYSTPTGMYLIRYLKKHKMPFIINSDGGIISYNEKKVNYVIKKYFIGSAKYWLSTGEETDKYLEYYGAKSTNIYHYPFTSIRKSQILENKITSSEKQLIKDELGIDSKYIIIAVGSFIYRKGFDILIKATQYINKDAQVIIVGGKPTYEYLKIMENLKLKNVKFIDFQNTKTLEKYYKISDVFVLPTREDIWGLVVNEAMAKGLPIITSNKCVAGKELIEDGINGYIVDVDDYNAISEKVNLLLNDENLRNSIISNNIKKINKYTIESMAEEHLNIFNDIMKKESK